MECASIMAFAKYRKIEAFQFFYTDDTLAGDEWEIKTLADNRASILQECLKIALKIAKEI